MGTHADWERAKELRDRAAYFLAKGYLNDDQGAMKVESVKFLAAESTMKKLERELDGRDPE